MQIRFRLGPFFLLSSCLIQSLMAQPEGFQIVSGQAIAPLIDANGTMIIQSENRAILSWDRFSVDLHEHVHFVQGGVNPAVLNRVVGDEASAILGRLSSNEGVYLLNPNGILIGPGALIETNGFVASTFDVLDQDFLNGKELLFEGTSQQAVINEGKIHSTKGDISLIASRVENIGQLETDRGSIHMTSSGTLLFKPPGTEHLYVRLSQDAPATICHSGAIEARGGEVYLVAEHGKTEISGKIHAQATERQGGTARLLGDEVAILRGAHVDVSAPEGDGVILVGGDYQGKNENVKNAAFTWIDKETVLKADATENGHGGKVIVWGDEATSHSGFISARGGREGGNGGFVEVSGKHLYFQGLVDRRAPMGEAGTLLLDPYDVTISVAATANENFAANTYTPIGTSANINTTDLVNNLGLGNVTVVTTGAGVENGDITINDPVVWTSNNSLTLSADGSINVNANVQNDSPGSGNISMTAASGTGISIGGGFIVSTSEGDVSLIGTSSTGGVAGVHLQGACMVRATGVGGSVSVTGTNNAATALNNHGILIGGSSTVSTGQSGITAGGSLTLTGTGSTNDPSPGTAGIRIEGGSSVLILGGGSSDITITGTCSTTASFGGILTVSNGTVIQTTDSGGTGAIHLIGNAPSISIYIDASDVATIQSGGDVNLDNGSGSGSIFIINDHTLTAAGNFTVGSNASSIFLGGTGTGNQGPIISTGGTANFLSVNCPVFLSADTTFNSSATGSAINFNSTIDGNGAGRALALDAGAGSITLGGVIGGATPLASLSASAASSIALTGNITTSGGAGVTMTGPVDLTTNPVTINTTTGNGAITFNSSVNGAQGLTVNAGTGIIRFLSGAGDITPLAGITAITSDNTVGGGLVLIGAFSADFFDGSSVTGRTSFTGAITTTTSTGILFGSPVEAFSSGASQFALTATSGPIVLSSSVGATSPFININSFTDQTMQLGGNITATNPITLRSTNLNLNQDVVILSSVSNVAIISPVNGAHALTLAGGAGANVAFSSTVGASTPLTSLLISSGGTANFGGNVTTTGTITVNPPATLGVASITYTGSNISFASTINSVTTARSLTLNATGSVSFGGVIGNILALNAFSVTAAPGGVSFGASASSVIANSFSIAAGIPATLAAATTAVNTSAANGAISFGGTINGASNLALTAGLGTITLTGVVGGSTPLTSLSATSTGSISLRNNITTSGATGVVMTGPVTLATNPITINTTTGNGAINFSSGTTTINGAQTLTLSAGSGTITLAGAVGGVTPISSLAATSTGSIVLANNITTGTVTGVTITGPVTLSTNPVIINTVTGNGPINFSSGTTTINGAQALTLSAGSGAITLAGAVGGVTPLGTMTVLTTNNTVGSGFRIGASINATSLIASGVTLRTTIGSTSTITTTSSGTGIAFGSVIEGLSSGGQGLTLAAGAGSITLASTVGATTALSSFSATGSAILVGGNISTANSIALNGASVISQNTTLLTSALGGTIDLTGTFDGPHVVVLTGGAASGIVTLQAAMGGVNPLTSLSVTANSIRLGANVTTSGNTIAMNNAVTMIGTSLLSTGATGTITFSSTVNGGFGLSANTSTMNFNSTVGNTTPLLSLTVNADSIVTHGNQSVSSGPMTYGGPVTLNQSTTFTNSGSSAITFQDSTLPLVTVGGISGNFPLNISALPSGTILVTGNIDTTGAGANGASATFTANGNISVQDVMTTGATNFNGGNVQMTSSTGSISVGTINANGAGSGAGASILLQPSSGFTSGSLGNIPLGVVVLNGDLLARGNGSGSVVISANRSTAMSIATITSSLLGNDVTINTPTFGVGSNEAITILGDLTFTNVTSMTVGDIVTLGNLTFSPGAAVGLLTHGSIPLLTFIGNLSSSPTAHFLAGGNLNNSPATTPSGPLNAGHVNGLTSGTLTYAPQSLILNFDSMSTPIVPPTPSPTIFPTSRESIINSFLIANSQMFYMLDNLPAYNHRSIKICDKDKEHCLSSFPWFDSWLPTNDVW